MENNEIKLAYGDKLKGKLFGLLKEREKHGEWESFLETIEIELLGLEEDLASIHYYTLCAKIKSLKYFTFSRKTLLLFK